MFQVWDKDDHRRVRFVAKTRMVRLICDYLTTTIYCFIHISKFLSFFFHDLNKSHIEAQQKKLQCRFMFQFMPSVFCLPLYINTDDY